MFFHGKKRQQFLARPRRHCGIPTQNQKMYQKSMVKNDMRFRAQNRHGKITKNAKNVGKK